MRDMNPYVETDVLGAAASERVVAFVSHGARETALNLRRTNAEEVPVVDLRLDAVGPTLGGGDIPREVEVAKLRVGEAFGVDPPFRVSHENVVVGPNRRFLAPRRGVRT